MTEAILGLVHAETKRRREPKASELAIAVDVLGAVRTGVFRDGRPRVHQKRFVDALFTNALTAVERRDAALAVASATTAAMRG